MKQYISPVFESVRLSAAAMLAASGDPVKVNTDQTRDASAAESKAFGTVVWDDTEQ